MTNPLSNSNASAPAPERTIFLFHPSAASIVIRPLRSILIFVVVFAVLWWFVPPSSQRTLGLAILLGLLILRVVWQAIWNACARYELTSMRVRATEGVFSRFGAEIPLGRVQNTFVSRSFVERLAGIGTIGIASAGTGGIEIVWSMIDNPGEVLAAVRNALDGNDNGDGLGDRLVRSSEQIQASSPTSRPIILGLVGGIGAGKSAVARELEARGALVLDSDTRAKDALETPEAKQAVVSWWGPDILRDGKVDRKRVADIVFADAAQRRRLEAFVHPRLKAGRRAEIESAAARNIRYVVIDAPLLLEAGVDQECDAVVFVDAPREQRLERVRSRGWDEKELDRREAAQMPLAEKRSRSNFVIHNDGDKASLASRMTTLIAEIESKFGGKAAHS